MRGVEAEITAPKEIQGVIVGVEATNKNQRRSDSGVVLNLMTAQGLRSVPLEQVQQIKLLDAPLDNEFRTALKVLATSHECSQTLLRPVPARSSVLATCFWLVARTFSAVRNSLSSGASRSLICCTCSKGTERRPWAVMRFNTDTESLRL